MFDELMAYQDALLEDQGSMIVSNVNTSARPGW